MNKTKCQVSAPPLTPCSSPKAGMPVITLNQDVAAVQTGFVGMGHYAMGKGVAEGIAAQLKAQIRARVQNIRAALTALQTDVEEMMEIGEPVTPGNQNWPQVNQAMVDIEALGHEARIFVVDMTRYREVYPFMWPPEPEIDE